jgi:hypothetical protein
MSFFYQRGKIITEAQWSRPSPENIIKFLDTFLPEVNSYGLDLRIMGNSLVDMSNTWDVDMFLTGEIDNQDLENLMHDMTDFSLNKCSLLVDIQWFSEYILNEVDENNVWKNRNFYRKLLNPIIRKSTKLNFDIDFRKNPNTIVLTEYLCQTNFGSNIPKKCYARIEKDGGTKTIFAEEWRKELLDRP